MYFCSCLCISQQAYISLVYWTEPHTSISSRRKLESLKHLCIGSSWGGSMLDLVRITVHFLWMPPNLLLATGKWPHFSMPLSLPFIHCLLVFAAFRVGKNSYYVFIQLLLRIKTSANSQDPMRCQNIKSNCLNLKVPNLLSTHYLESCEGPAEGKCKACALLSLLFERGFNLDDTP